MGNSPDAFNTALDRTHQSLASLWRESLQTDPNRDLLIWQGERITLGAMHRRASSIASTLCCEGVQPGDPVGVMLDNHPDHIAVIIALALTGAVWVPIDRRHTATNIRSVLDEIDLCRIIAEESYRDTIAQANYPRGVDTPASMARPVDGSSPDTSPDTSSDARPVSRLPGDTRAILFTSGSTGRPKGVRLTEQMLLASGHLCGIAGDADSEQVFYVWEPLNHIGGAQLVPMALYSRAMLALTDRFSVSRFWGQVVASGATRIHYLGGILDHLLSAPPGEYDRAHRVALGFGAGASVAAARAFEQRFGIPLREVYGQTEASSFACINHERYPGSIGRALPCFDLQLLDEQGAAVATDSVGEITLAGRVPGLLTPGYHGNAAATARALRGGRFHTGDLARQDATGRLFFVGRLGDRLRVRGENVSAWEIEAVLRRCPGVVDAAVLGTDADGGEQEIVAYVQLTVIPPPDAHDRMATDLLAHAAQDLAAFQLPQYLFFVDALPRTPSQRVEKHRLSVTPAVLARAWTARPA